jgi:large subunit ribosomal protein L17
MKHCNNHKKLNRTSEHRKALMVNLVRALTLSGSIETTLPKAKFLRPFIEKLVTKARRVSGDLARYREMVSLVRDPVIAKKLCEDIAPRFLARPGGYTRIVRVGNRFGDMAPMAVVQWVDYKKGNA